MDLYEFIALDLEKKAETVWNHATYLTWRPWSRGKVNLYALEDFFVEVYYDDEFNCMDDIRSFKCLDCLDEYLERIDLTGLMQDLWEI